MVGLHKIDVIEGKTTYVYKKDGAYFALTPEESQSMVQLLAAQGFSNGYKKWKVWVALAVCVAAGGGSVELFDLVMLLL